jgi:hypothetical protein
MISVETNGYILTALGLENPCLFPIFECRMPIEECP